jgi:hypothetical protein
VHVLDVMCSMRYQHGALAQIAAQHADLLLGAKGAAQKPVGVQLLQPLTVEHITLASRHVLNLARIEQPDLEAALHQQLEKRYPVDTGGLHHHSFHPTPFQPLRQRTEIRREGAEAAYRLPFRVTSRRHRHPVLGCSDVNACGV